jgi:pimeloyl-ACP methyl ester carboxylesterase
MATSAAPMENRSVTPRYFEGFPVGYYDDLHPNLQMNYEMNRFSTGEADMIDEMRSVSARIHDLADYIREFLALGDAALASGETLKGAYYIRGAEFCMFANDPRKHARRRQFIQLMREQFDIADSNHFVVPYESGALSAYRLTPPNPTGTFVIHGGFDTYIEEWFPMQRYFARAGLDVVIFDGPGQGTALHNSHLPFTPEWHKPVGAVLDYFTLTDVTLLGISFGGCLALRAAAHEPRVRRVVADDTDTNHLEVMLGLVKPSVRAALTSLLHMGADHVIDRLFERAAKESAASAFGVQQGMLVTGSQTPSEYLNKVQLYRTDDVSPLIEQDVLLLGGTEDFCIPLHQFYDQSRMLTSARSLTTRLFTRHEQGQQHCQIGNLGLQFRVIKDWLAMLQERDKSIS